MWVRSPPFEPRGISTGGNDRQGTSMPPYTGRPRDLNAARLLGLDGIVRPPTALDVCAQPSSESRRARRRSGPITRKWSTVERVRCGVVDGVVRAIAPATSRRALSSQSLWRRVSARIEKLYRAWIVDQQRAGCCGRCRRGVDAAHGTRPPTPCSQPRFSEVRRTQRSRRACLAVSRVHVARISSAGPAAA
jgi:hypothetical protein